ncbi:hypothetical protein [Flavobacterium psychrophilum]|uniref:hypothetical protein n=1 Tax=Flavobacterium psychrophilum TaxID=96345 RepID=UPI001D062B74|nr:hypothetical protein [Flavobacterium psychrophilum]MCB6062685.1 hypothetical protein [Flavobacterium psychrophilum]
MENNLEALCKKMISDIQKESDAITKQLKDFYDANKNNADVKTLTENTFQEQITEFKIKYLNRSAGILSPKGEDFEFIALDNICSEKLYAIVDNFVNYIDRLS